MNTLYFEKLSQFDRPAEPVTVSIPFANGKLTDPRQLRVLDGDEALPVQARVLATWPDGSVKWLLVHLQPDLPEGWELYRSKQAGQVSYQLARRRGD